MKKVLFSYTFLSLLIISSCIDQNNVKPLPILGEKEIINGDTIFHTIRDFRFINQDSAIITNKTFENGIYIVDFFFTSCPTICPITTKQMSRIQEKFKDNPKVQLMAHSIDYKYDSVPVLKKYSQKTGGINGKWHFVKGKKDEIYSIAEDYFSVAKDDPTQPGGFDHSGRFILIDKNRQVRSYCDGTDIKDVNRFMEDIQLLLNEN